MMEMELSPFTLFLIFQADVVRSVLSPISFFAGVFFVASVIIYGVATGCAAVDGDEHAEKARKEVKPWMKGAMLSFLLCLAGLSFIPKTSTLVAMYGIPAVIELAKAPQVRELSDNSLKAVNKLLKRYINEKD